VDLDANNLRFSRPYSVRIYGKGRKERTCPLWKETLNAVRMYLERRSVRPTDAVPLFVNVEGNRLSRFGLRYIIAHRVSEAAKSSPTLLTRNVTPHTIRHYLPLPDYVSYRRTGVVHPAEARSSTRHSIDSFHQPRAGQRSQP
jgi:site-specific recombinase XerD